MLYLLLRCHDDLPLQGKVLQEQAALLLHAERHALLLPHFLRSGPRDGRTQPAEGGHGRQPVPRLALRAVLLRQRAHRRLPEALHRQLARLQAPDEIIPRREGPAFGVSFQSNNGTSAARQYPATSRIA